MVGVPVRRSYTDLETGEVHELEHLEPIKPKRAPEGRIDEPFAIIFPRLFVDLILSPNQTRAFAFLAARMDFDGKPFGYSNNELARELGITASRASELVRALRDKHLVVKVPGSRKVRLNPHYVWRGSPKGRRTALATPEWSAA